MEIVLSEKISKSYGDRNHVSCHVQKLWKKENMNPKGGATGKRK